MFFGDSNDEEDMMQKAVEESRRLFREEEARRVRRHQQVQEAWEKADLQGLEKRLSWFIRFPPLTSGELDPMVWTRIVNLYHHFQRVSQASTSTTEDEDAVRPDVEQARVLLFRILSSDGGNSIHPQIGRFLEFLDVWIKV